MLNLILLKKDAVMHSGVIWNCRESVENKDAKIRVLMLFETKFWNCKETLESQNAKWCVLTLSTSMSARVPKDTFHAMDWTNRQWKF